MALDTLQMDDKGQLGAAGAVATTKRLLSEIANLSRHFLDCEKPDQTDNWLVQIEQMFQFCQGIEEGSLKGQAALLINMQSLWDDLPENFRDKWNNDFWYYAKTKTGRDQGTLENHMRAVRTFMIGKAAPEGPVAVLVRDAKGVPVLDSAGSPTVKYVPWDPTTVPMSKLVAVAGRANAKQMTPKLWSMTADPGATWTQLQIEMSTGGGGGESGSVDMGFYLAGPYLFVREGQVEAFVADLSLPHDDDVVLTSSDSLRERALRRLCMVLNVKHESETAHEALARAGLKLYPKDSIDIPA